jgi:hypothetical protein
MDDGGEPNEDGLEMIRFLLRRKADYLRNFDGNDSMHLISRRFLPFRRCPPSCYHSSLSVIPTRQDLSTVSRFADLNIT